MRQQGAITEGPEAFITAPHTPRATACQ